MSRELTDGQVKAAILEFLLMKGRWGSHYFPAETLVNWFSRRVKGDGRRVRRSLKELAGEGYVLVHKRGETVSLNPSMNRDIRAYIKTVPRT